MSDAPWFPPSVLPDEWRISHRGGGTPSTHHLDAVITGLGDLQHGVVTVRQLLALGATRRVLEARVASGHLFRVRTGVYAVGRRRLTPAGRRMAVVLAAGAGARLAGWSGCAQRGLLPDGAPRVEIAVPRARRVVLPGVRVTRSDAREDEVTLADGIPTHAVERLLLDLAVRGDEALEWAWRQAIYTRQLEIRRVERLLGARDGEPGTPALRVLYERRARLVGTLRSRFELLMLPLFREAGLPEPLCNVPWEVAPGVTLTPDFRVPSLRLVIEADGRDGHADVEFLLGDEQRDRLYAACGHTCLRYGFWEVRRERGRVLGELRARVARKAS